MQISPRPPILIYLGLLAILAAVAAPQPRDPGTIVFTHAPDGAGPWPIEGIYTMAADGTNVLALTSDGHSHDASWSPDGKQILFVHDATVQTKPAYKEEKEFESHHPIELHVMDRNGSNRRLLRRMEPVIYSAAWSPDGKTLAVNALTDDLTKLPHPADEPARSGLFLLSPDGKSKARLLFRSAFTPAWSPDGKKLAFSLEQPRGRWAIHVANADGSGDVRLTDPGITAGEPSWSPDGKLIAFDEIPARDGKQQIFVMKPDGSDSRQITSDPSWSCVHPSWSPDGARLVFSCNSASVPCGRGVSDAGTPEPACTRRIFSVTLNEPGLRTRRLSSIDGFQPAFSPVPAAGRPAREN